MVPDIVHTYVASEALVYLPMQEHHLMEVSLLLHRAMHLRPIAIVIAIIIMIVLIVVVISMIFLPIVIEIIISIIIVVVIIIAIIIVAIMLVKIEQLVVTIY